MIEIWKCIPGYKRIYEASSLGRIKSLPGLTHKKDIILRPSKSKDGYYRVCIRKSGISKVITVHRLIAKTFIRKRGKNLEVNHKDGNKLNNKVENLEWVSRSRNIQHMFTDLGRKSIMFGKFGKDNHLSKKVLCVNTGKTYDCAKDAGKELGLNYASIRNVCCGANKSLKKMIFKYV